MTDHPIGRVDVLAHAVRNCVQRIEEKMRLDLRSQMPELRRGKFSRKFHGVYFPPPPHPELTHSKNDDQDHEVADDVLLQFIEAADEDVTEIVGFAGERVRE